MWRANNPGYEHCGLTNESRLHFERNSASKELCFQIEQPSKASEKQDHQTTESEAKLQKFEAVQVSRSMVPRKITVSPCFIPFPDDLRSLPGSDWRPLHRLPPGWMGLSCSLMRILAQALPRYTCCQHPPPPSTPLLSSFSQQPQKSNKVHAKPSADDAWAHKDCCISLKKTYTNKQTNDFWGFWIHYAKIFIKDCWALQTPLHIHALKPIGKPSGQQTIHISQGANQNHPQPVKFHQDMCICLYLYVFVKHKSTNLMLFIERERERDIEKKK